MSEHPGFCPACFAPLAQEAETCPACGARMTELSARDYREKLVHALLHPLADVRMRAIIALGLRGETGRVGTALSCPRGICINCVGTKACPPYQA